MDLFLNARNQCFFLNIEAVSILNKKLFLPRSSKKLFMFANKQRRIFILIKIYFGCSYASLKLVSNQFEAVFESFNK
jgi:hypothetical protein